jgi:hypothetical protein
MDFDEMLKKRIEDGKLAEEQRLLDEQSATASSELGQHEQAGNQQSHQQGDSELLKLREELAQREAELNELRAVKAAEAPEEFNFYENEDHRIRLSDALGEDTLTQLEAMQRIALKGVHKKAQEKVSLLEQETKRLKTDQVNAEFIRTVPKNVMDTFNDPKFKAFAKGEKLGRKTLLDELESIVSEADIQNSEYLIEQVKAFQEANKSVRKAQLPAGNSPMNNASAKAGYDAAHAQKLRAELNRYRVGTKEFDVAKNKLEAYFQQYQTQEV